jgi:hypothetical protein
VVSRVDTHKSFLGFVYFLVFLVKLLGVFTLPFTALPPGLELSNFVVSASYLHEAGSHMMRVKQQQEAAVAGLVFLFSYEWLLP